MPEPPANPALQTVHARAHAKVNLALSVGPPVPANEPGAGYHPIYSWMHAVELHDELIVKRTGRAGDADDSAHEVAWVHDESDEGVSLTAGPAGEDNLIVRAHRALAAHVGTTLPAQMSLTKRIPVGGGMGGGSSDGAVALLALNDLFELDLDEPALHAIAIGLGSDIPFFVDLESWRAGLPPRPAIVSGLGEGVERLDRRSGAVTLICPDFGCATGAVYRAFDDDPSPGVDRARVKSLAGAADPDWGALFNDLAAPAERVEPRLRAVRERLGPGWHVSGSGSTVFAIDAATPGPDALDPNVLDPGWVVGTRLI